MHPLRIVVVEGIGYVIGWVAWPLAAAYIAPLLGRGENYIRYIVAYNWSAGTQIVALLLLLVFQSSGLVSEGTFAGIGLVALLILLSITASLSALPSTLRSNLPLRWLSENFYLAR